MIFFLMIFFCTAENNINGKLPTEIAKLSQLSVLDVNSNSLSGPIPSELGELINLQVLRLEENDLIGWIPDSLSSLTNLELLAVHNNTIIGAMPEGLCSIVEEATANMSFHQLDISADCLQTKPAAKGSVTCNTNCCSMCCAPIWGCEGVSG